MRLINGTVAPPHPSVWTQMRGAIPFAAMISQRLSLRPDSEHEMAVNRIILNAVVFVYLLSANLLGENQNDVVFQNMSWLCLFYGIAGIGLFVAVLADTKASAMRRRFAIVLDLAVVSCTAYLGGGATAFIYPLYLWTIFGNGFRFGVSYLRFSMVVAVADFLMVVAFSPFWQLHTTLAYGLVAGLIMLPLYVGVLIRKLSEAKRQAEEASQAKSLFLASVSHELRTPLTAIIGLSDLMEDTPLSNEQAELVQTVGAAGRGLLRLINSLLDFSRTEVGKMPVENSPIDLFGLLSETRDMLLVQAHAKGLALALHIDASVPHHILGSQRHLQETLLNLAGNAVKFTETGHVLIAVRLAGERGAKLVIEFEVSDTGIGIAPEAQARIFDKFTQADSTIMDRFGGTGLGLAIAKQHVAALNGEISVASTPGTGSTFRFDVEVGLDADKAMLAVDDALLSGMLDGRMILLLTQDVALAPFVLQHCPGAQIKQEVASACDFITLQSQSRAIRLVVFVDETSFAGEMETLAERLTAADKSQRVILIAIGGEQVAPRLSAAARRYFLTTMPRPNSPASLALSLARIGRKSLAKLPSQPKIALGRRRILVAEDNKTNQKVIARMLERVGHRVEIVDNGEAALDALADHEFDLVLMDVNMPVMNGIEATKFYQFTLPQRNVPIVGLTADVTEAGQARCLEAGMLACLGKPIDAARLTATIQAIALHPTGWVPDEELPDPLPAMIGSVSIQLPGKAVLNVGVLAELEDLGGRDFVDEVVEQFCADASSILKSLSQAAATRDAVEFNDGTHALRSCAANVGAQTLFQRCLDWHAVDAEAMQQNGAAMLLELERELDAARAALLAYQERHPKMAAAPESAVVVALHAARSA